MMRMNACQQICAYFLTPLYTEIINYVLTIFSGVNMRRRCITQGTITPFASFLSGENVYVDKTKAACLMAEQEGFYLLTRPRRMGKSTMCLTLKHLFSKGTAGTQGLYCYDHWPETKRYFVIHLDWSDYSYSSADEFNEYLIDDIKNIATYFGVKIDESQKLRTIISNFVYDITLKLSDSSWLSSHPELFDGDRPLSTDSIVLLIDEYDVPLTESLNNPTLFDELKREYRSIFATLKRMPFRFLFVTGVSSYVQSSIFGSPNQFIDISLDPRYATCCGYTQEELEHYFAPELDRSKQVLELSYDELLTKLSYYYGGYFFNSLNDGHNDSQRLFNPVSVSSFLTSPIKGFLNHWGKTGGGSEFLLTLIYLSSQEISRQLLRKIYKSVFDSLDLSDPKVNEFIEAWSPFFLFELLSHDQPQDKDRLLCKDADSLKVDLSEDELFTIDNAIAILYP